MTVVGHLPPVVAPKSRQLITQKPPVTERNVTLAEVPPYRGSSLRAVALRQENEPFRRSTRQIPREDLHSWSCQMFRIFELVFAFLIIGVTLATYALTLPASTPNGMRRAASLLARKSTLPKIRASRRLDVFLPRSI